MDRCSVASTGIMRDAIQRRAAEPSVRGLATVSVACFGAMQYLQRRVASSSPPSACLLPPGHRASPPRLDFLLLAQIVA